MNKLIFIDSHCHLDMLSEKQDLALVLERASKDNVKYIQTICTKLSEFETLLNIATKYPQVFTSVGIHPSELNETDITDHTILERLSNHPKVIGFGETGLDYHYSDKKTPQIESFKQHIMAASNANLPLIVHTREAEEDTINILTSEMKNSPFSGVIHCFTSNLDFAKKVLDIGMYISISGIVTFKNANAIKEAVKFIPLDRLLIETDAPFLAPVPMRGKENEPAFVKYVAENIAQLKNIKLEDVAKATTDNFFHLFHKSINASTISLQY